MSEEGVSLEKGKESLPAKSDSLQKSVLKSVLKALVEEPVEVGFL